MNKTYNTRTAVIFSVVPLLAFTMLFGCEEVSEESTLDTRLEATEEGDLGKQPWFLDIEHATVDNTDYRNTKWTGEYMQMVLMSLKPGEEIDLEVHHDHDQFIRLEQGEALISMGKSEDDLNHEQTIYDDWAVFIPAGYWHYVKNTGTVDLKLYTIYAPAEHPAGTVNVTIEDARRYHDEHH